MALLESQLVQKGAGTYSPHMLWRLRRAAGPIFLPVSMCNGPRSDQVAAFPDRQEERHALPAGEDVARTENSGDRDGHDHGRVDAARRRSRACRAQGEAS